VSRIVDWLRRGSAAVRRNERLAAWLLVGAIAMVCFGLLAPPIRGRLLDRAQMAVARWDERWTQRVERGEALVAERRYAEAVTYLEALDRVFPARHVKHRRDIERERLLRALGTANLELGRKRASLAAFRRAVDFDPRNYLNHFALAGAALALNETDEALREYARTLEIHPSHFPTVAALAAYYFGQADYQAVVDVYEAYLDADLLYPTTVRLGEGVGQADAPVDGRSHQIEVPLRVADRVNPPRGGRLTLDAGPHPTAVRGVILFPPRRAGVLDADPIVLRPRVPWRLRGSNDEREASSLEIPVGPETGPVVRIRLDLILRKTVDPATWEMVATAYENLLEFEALEIARERSAIREASAGQPPVPGAVVMTSLARRTGGRGR
jgi:tetratricopeptide (TPR) repeat protein